MILIVSGTNDVSGYVRALIEKFKHSVVELKLELTQSYLEETSHYHDSGPLDFLTLVQADNLLTGERWFKVPESYQLKPEINAVY